MSSRRGTTRRQERARVYTKRIGDENKLSPDFAGVMCYSPLQTTSAARQARAWVYIRMAMRIGMATSHRQNLRAQCSAPRIASLQTTSTAQHQQRASYAIFGLVRMPSRWSATIFCLHFAARNFFSKFRFFDFSILNPTAGYIVKIDSFL